MKINFHFFSISNYKFSYKIEHPAHIPAMDCGIPTKKGEAASLFVAGK